VERSICYIWQQLKSDVQLVRSFVGDGVLYKCERALKWLALKHDMTAANDMRWIRKKIHSIATYIQSNRGLHAINKEPDDSP
jgi:hypothetical protein